MPKVFIVIISSSGCRSEETTLFDLLMMFQKKKNKQRYSLLLCFSTKNLNSKNEWARKLAENYDILAHKTRWSLWYFPHNICSIYILFNGERKKKRWNFLLSPGMKDINGKSDEIKLIWFTNNVYKFDFIEHNLFDHCINLSVFQSISVHKKIYLKIILIIFFYLSRSDEYSNTDSTTWDFYPLV